MIRNSNGYYYIETKNSAYAFRILPEGLPEHLHYGAPLGIREETPDYRMEMVLSALSERHFNEVGNAPVRDAGGTLCPENLRQEFSVVGSGDTGDCFVMVRDADGNRTSDFRFLNAEIVSGEKLSLPGLPSSYGEAEELVVRYREAQGDLILTLTYSIFADSDAVVRSASIENAGKSPVDVLRLMSGQIDFGYGAYELSSFHGAWAREMGREVTPIGAARVVNSSRTGVSSNRANPFTMVSRVGTTEDAGECYGLNLVWSGDHYTSAQRSPYGKTRILLGVNSEDFCWHLEAGETFTAPEAVMVYSAEGFGGMSRAMHAFVREHIVSGIWKSKTKPILLNSWEACYFKISEKKMLKLAADAKKAGIELVVMDDGWFGKRNDDSSSLGDFVENKKKLPHGVQGLASKIHKDGLQFGIWVEPEMVNCDSDLYRAHPDWALQAPHRVQAEGRKERFLDLCNPTVVEHMCGVLDDLLADGNIHYVKWDMNRIMTDVYSPYLPKERQQETGFRYVLGLYRMMQHMTETHPEVLFEGCASGGNRFDLGILRYFPEIWASDDTDAGERTRIQEGYSYGYPQSVVSCHVSDSPNHQTLRRTSLSTRFAVSCFGNLGYELDLGLLSKDERKAVQAQTALYKEWREVLQYGDFYRIENGNIKKWMVVSPDRSRAVCLLFQEMATPNFPNCTFRARGLDPDKWYRFYNLPEEVDVRHFGSLINTQSPVPVKNGSLTESVISKFVKFPGDTEDAVLSGAALMHAGIALSPAYGGTGFEKGTRYFPDFAGRLYFIEEVSEQNLLPAPCVEEETDFGIQKTDTDQ